MKPLSKHLARGRRGPLRMALFVGLSLSFMVSEASITGDFSGDLIVTYCDISGNTCEFTIMTKKTVKVPHVMLSLDKDFSRIKYLFELKKGKTSTIYTKTVNADEIEQGTYYWRAADASGNMIESEDGNILAFGSAVSCEYSITPDTQFYDDAELNDGSELSLESIWLRSEMNNNRMDWSNAPYCGKSKIYATPGDDYVNNHGMVVRNGVIYVARGSYNVSNWKYDRQQLWVDRYDLETGASLPQLRVRQDNGEDFPDKDLMSLLGEDADGTVYFTSSIIVESGSGSGNKIRLYTLDLDNLVSQNGYDVALSHFEYEFTVPEVPDYMRFCTVWGSIKSKDYYLWGAPGDNDLDTKLANLKIPVYRWHFKDGSASLTEALIDQFATIDGDPAIDVRLTSPKVMPISGDQFYFQGKPLDNFVLFHPALYAMPTGSSNLCQLLTSLSDAPKDLQNTYVESPLGVSLFTVGSTPVLGYGRRNSRGSSVQLVELPESMLSFKEANPLWNINPSGFSDYYIQGCNVSYLPDDDESIDGKLLVYVPNGGLGLYRLAAKGTTVGIENNSANFEVTVCGRMISLPGICHSVSIIDISGETCISAREAEYVDASHLMPGIYFIVSPSLPRPYKISLQ